MSLKTLLALAIIALFTGSSYCAECLTSLPINYHNENIRQIQFILEDTKGKTLLSKNCAENDSIFPLHSHYFWLSSQICFILFFLGSVGSD
ncbi:MAG: hypothetical protein NTW85_01355 [Methylococcales bacterium]|nr:hypothetical protein [Methylococcales bacterium]